MLLGSRENEVTTAPPRPSGDPPKDTALLSCSAEGWICLSQARSLSPFPICVVRITLLIPWGSSGGLGNVYTWLLKYNPLQGQPRVCLGELFAHTCFRGSPKVTAEVTTLCHEPPRYQLIRGRGDQRGYPGTIPRVWCIAVSRAAASKAAYGSSWNAWIGIALEMNGWCGRPDKVRRARRRLAGPLLKNIRNSLPPLWLVIKWLVYWPTVLYASPGSC